MILSFIAFDAKLFVKDLTDKEKDYMNDTTFVAVWALILALFAFVVGVPIMIFVSSKLIRIIWLLVSICTGFVAGLLVGYVRSY